MNVAAGPKLAAAVTNSGKHPLRKYNQKINIHIQVASVSLVVFAKVPNFFRAPSTN
jgi:hypothetical protein